MAPIEIGERKLPAARPADLDDRLVAATGCTAHEHAEMLARSATPGQIARVLVVMLTDEDPPGVGALAEMIAADDPLAVRDQVVALLDEKD